MKLYEKLKVQAENCLYHLKAGMYNGYTGWMNVSNDEVERIKNVANKVRKNSEVLVIVGVGGSYLGARAIIEALTSKFKKDIEIVYLGTNLSPLDLKETLEYLETKDFTVNVISKSGTTLEPAIAFSFLKKLLFKKYSKKEAFERMIITTDAKNGLLREYADKNDVESFIIPEDVGGRFSVLTPVGLLPIAIAGIDIERLLLGAQDVSEVILDEENKENIAIEYAVQRNYNYQGGDKIELLVTYEERLKYFGEWWKQLFGESEGKDGKGLFPASATLTTDLHSLGQILQDGEKNILETHLVVNNYNTDLEVILEGEDLESMNYVSGKTMSYINEQAKTGTIKAHSDGGVTCLEFRMDKLDEYSLGAYIYFFMVSCAISAMVLKVNPFDQPGVEKYKKNVKELLK